MASKFRITTEALFESKLGIPMADYVHRSRESGSSWRGIAREILDATGGIVDLTDVTLINWYGDDDRESVS